MTQVQASPAALKPSAGPSNASSTNIPFNFNAAQLLAHLRHLTLRHDEVGKEIVLNELLRLLVARKEYEQADRIIKNNQPSQPYRSTNQAARFHYYVALVSAVRLDYVAANANVQQALRKAPERAVGFRIAAMKLHLTTQLLLGEIPPRADFLDSSMKEALQPYMQLTGNVRFGNLVRFKQLLRQYQTVLEHDHMYNLLVRVRQNVIKTGLRRICQAYSRISFSDVCEKLALENPEDAEYIVGKAIRDGVIEATIDAEKRIIVTSDTVDVYHTTEPMQAFQKRVNHLNITYDEAQRAMRYVDPELEEQRRAEETKRTEFESDIDGELDPDDFGFDDD